MSFFDQYTQLQNLIYSLKYHDTFTYDNARNFLTRLKNSLDPENTNTYRVWLNSLPDKKFKRLMRLTREILNKKKYRKFDLHKQLEFSDSPIYHRNGKIIDDLVYRWKNKRKKIKKILEKTIEAKPVPAAVPEESVPEEPVQKEVGEMETQTEEPVQKEVGEMETQTESTEEELALNLSKKLNCTTESNTAYNFTTFDSSDDIIKVIFIVVSGRKVPLLFDTEKNIIMDCLTYIEVGTVKSSTPSTLHIDWEITYPENLSLLKTYKGKHLFQLSDSIS